VTVVAGVDLGGTAVNYTLMDHGGKFLIDGLCEHPALAKQGPEVCLRQIADGLKIAVAKAGVQLVDVVAVGLDTPGPASAAGQLSGRGSIFARDWRAHLVSRCVI
jgi:glucokinase